MSFPARGSHRMSKASRMFRSRSNRGANLAIRPVADFDYPTFAEADLSACLAALYNSPPAAFLDESGAGMVPDASSTDQAVPAPEGHGLLSFTPKPTAERAEPDEVLAILLQTIDSAADPHDSGNAEVLAATFPDESTIISVSASDSRRTELFIVEKPVAPIRS